MKTIYNRLDLLEHTAAEIRRQQAEKLKSYRCRVRTLEDFEQCENHIREHTEIEELILFPETCFLFLFGEDDNINSVWNKLLIFLDRWYCVLGCWCCCILRKGEPYFDRVVSGEVDLVSAVIAHSHQNYFCSMHDKEIGITFEGKNFIEIADDLTAVLSVLIDGAVKRQQDYENNPQRPWGQKPRTDPYEDYVKGVTT